MRALDDATDYRYTRSEIMARVHSLKTYGINFAPIPN